MTTIICTGTLFSGWQQVCDDYLLAAADSSPVLDKLSAISSDIDQRYLGQLHTHDQKPFHPGQEFEDRAAAVNSSINRKQTLIWPDEISCLLLDFWRSKIRDSKFLLFYSSPERELVKFFESELFDINTVDQVIAAWVIRTRALLIFFSNNRKNCLLVNTDSAGLEVDRLIYSINDHFGLGFPVPSAKNRGYQEPDVLDEFLATAFILNNDTVSETYDELRSLATILCKDDKDLIDIHVRSGSLLRDSLKESRSYKETLESNRKMSERLELSRVQLQKLQQELEFYYSKHRELIELGEQLNWFMRDDHLPRLVRMARVANS